MVGKLKVQPKSIVVSLGLKVTCAGISTKVFIVLCKSLIINSKNQTKNPL